jgi:hypothetical protein
LPLIEIVGIAKTIERPLKKRSKKLTMKQRRLRAIP